MYYLRRNSGDALKKLEQGAEGGDADSIITLVKLQLHQGKVPKLKHLAVYLGNLDQRRLALEEERDEALEKALNTLFLSIRDFVIELIEKFSIKNFTVDLFWDQDFEDEDLEENQHRMIPFDGTEEQVPEEIEGVNSVHFWQITAEFLNGRPILVQATTPLRGIKNRELIESLKNLLWTLNRVELQSILFHFFNLETIKEQGYFDEDEDEDEEDEDEEDEDKDTTRVTRSDLKYPYPTHLTFTNRRIVIRYNSEVFLVFKYEELAEFIADRMDDEID